MICKEIEQFSYLLYIYLSIYTVFSIWYLSMYFTNLQDKNYIITFITMVFSFGTLVWFISSTVLLIKYIINKKKHNISIHPDIAVTVTTN